MCARINAITAYNIKDGTTGIRSGLLPSNSTIFTAKVNAIDETILMTHRNKKDTVKYSVTKESQNSLYQLSVIHQDNSQQYDSSVDAGTWGYRGKPECRQSSKRANSTDPHLHSFMEYNTGTTYNTLKEIENKK